MAIHYQNQSNPTLNDQVQSAPKRTNHELLMWKLFPLPIHRLVSRGPKHEFSRFGKVISLIRTIRWARCHRRRAGMSPQTGRGGTAGGSDAYMLNDRVD